MKKRYFKEIIISVVIFFIMLCALGLSIAYYFTTMTGENAVVSVKAAKVGSLNFEIEEVDSSGILPGWVSEPKSINITCDDCDADTDYACYYYFSNNELPDMYIKTTGSSGAIDEWTQISTGKSKVLLASGVFNGEGEEEVTYQLNFKETGLNQDSQQSKIIEGTIECTYGDGTKQKNFSDDSLQSKKISALAELTSNQKTIIIEALLDKTELEDDYSLKDIRATDATIITTFADFYDYEQDVLSGLIVQSPVINTSRDEYYKHIFTDENATVNSTLLNCDYSEEYCKLSISVSLSEDVVGNNKAIVENATSIMYVGASIEITVYDGESDNGLRYETDEGDIPNILVQVLNNDTSHVDLIPNEFYSVGFLNLDSQTVSGVSQNFEITFDESLDDKNVSITNISKITDIEDAVRYKKTIEKSSLVYVGTNTAYKEETNNYLTDNILDSKSGLLAYADISKPNKKIAEVASGVKRVIDFSAQDIIDYSAANNFTITSIVPTCSGNKCRITITETFNSEYKNATAYEGTYSNNTSARILFLPIKFTVLVSDTELAASLYSEEITELVPVTNNNNNNVITPAMSNIPTGSSSTTNNQTVTYNNQITTQQGGGSGSSPATTYVGNAVYSGGVITQGPQLANISPINTNKPYERTIGYSQTMVIPIYEDDVEQIDVPITLTSSDLAHMGITDLENYEPTIYNQKELDKNGFERYYNLTSANGTYPFNATAEDLYNHSVRLSNDPFFGIDCNTLTGSCKLIVHLDFNDYSSVIKHRTIVNGVEKDVVYVGISYEIRKGNKVVFQETESTTGYVNNSKRLTYSVYSMNSSLALNDQYDLLNKPRVMKLSYNNKLASNAQVAGIYSCVSTVQCRESDYIYTEGTQVTIDIINSGMNYVSLIAVSSTGELSASQTFSYYIDQEAPSANISIGNLHLNSQNESVASQSSKALITVSDVEDAGSGTDGYCYLYATETPLNIENLNYIRVNGVRILCSQINNYTLNLTPGLWYPYVFIEDGVGNVFTNISTVTPIRVEYDEYITNKFNGSTISIVDHRPIELSSNVNKSYIVNSLYSSDYAYKLADFSYNPSLYQSGLDYVGYYNYSNYSSL